MWHHDKLTENEINHCWPEAVSAPDDYQASTDSPSQSLVVTVLQWWFHRREISQINVTSDDKQIWRMFSVSCLSSLVLCLAPKHKKVLAEQTVQALHTQHSVADTSAPSQWLLWDFWCRIIIVSKDSQLGFKLTFGSNIIIVLIRHTWGGFGQIIICGQAASGHLKASSVVMGCLGCLGGRSVSDGIRQNTMACY